MMHQDDTELSRGDMPKAYDPHSVEERLYEWWEQRGYFQPRIDVHKTPFVISIPPPNVTGELHHGHAMFLAFEDLMIRWHRMLGEPTLWVPGSDHAGIATQNVVERALDKQGISRRDLGREEFVKRVWEWKDEYGSMITHQIRRLGASCDWTRERFTLDEGLSRAVREAFVTLFEKGLIYRGPRLINWCPHDESAISDLEVDHEETTGKLYYVRYPLAPTEAKSQIPNAKSLIAGDESPITHSPNHRAASRKDPITEYITVATTRPETMLGDTAIAVHPRDKRYRNLIGRTAILPMLNRPIPIISDEAVDQEFGTGAVKVTPGHDPTDHDMGQRHQLPVINIMNKDATINENGGPYAGLDRYVARERLVKDLEAAGLLNHVQDHTMSIGRCQRCDTVVEPLVSTQWFVKIEPLAKPAIAAVRRGRIKIIPERFNKIYYDWMENIRDWCISRQLWWGHRIPVWYCEKGHETCARTDPTNCAVCGSSNIHQDEDVLDTWFSSALWPFSTLGWPNKTFDLEYFYPTSVLETGYDILFFWVARMIMMGLECTHQVPFRNVYLHGLIRHKDGSKISKSNPQPGDNPLDVIADYSADALRFTIITSSAPGNDTRLDLEKVEHARNFGNKIWNMARFVVSSFMFQVSGSTIEIPELANAAPLDPMNLQPETLSLPDRWILSRLHHVIQDVNTSFRNWDFGEGTRLIHDFLWSEFADWYIEASKIPLNGTDQARKKQTLAILLHTLDQGLRMLHPIMPFVTEETWQHLPRPGDAGEGALIVAPYPKADKRYFDARAEKSFEIVMDTVRAIRNARTEFNVEAGKRIPAQISAGAAASLLESQKQVIAFLARVDPDNFNIDRHLEKPAQSLALLVGTTQIFLPLAGMIDVEKEKTRLTNEVAKVKADMTRAENLLATEFSKRAPKEVVQKTRDQLEANRERTAHLETQLANLEGRAIHVALASMPTPRTKPARRRAATRKRPGAKRPAPRAARARVATRRTGKPAARTRKTQARRPSR